MKFIVPIISAIAWLVTLVTLLCLWLFKDDQQQYQSDYPDILYISQIGAVYHILFIVGCVITATFFILTLILFMFTHRGHPRRWADVLTFIFGCISATCLILLSIFDSEKYDALHWGFTIAFVLFGILSGLFNVVAISSHRHSDATFKFSFIVKILFVIASTILFVAMLTIPTTCEINEPGCTSRRNVAAILEWSLGLMYFFYILSWAVDFVRYHVLLQDDWLNRDVGDV